MLPNEPKNEETTYLPNSFKSTLPVNKQNAKLSNHEIRSCTNKTDKATLPDVVDENQSANSENVTFPNELDSFDPVNNNQNDKAMLPNEDPSSNNPECPTLPDLAEVDSDQSEDPNQMEQEYLMDSDPEIQIKKSVCTSPPSRTTRSDPAIFQPDHRPNPGLLSPRVENDAD